MSNLLQSRVTCGVWRAQILLSPLVSVGNALLPCWVFLGGQSPCRQCWLSVRLTTSVQRGQCLSWPLCSSCSASRGFGVPILGHRAPESPLQHPELHLLSSGGFHPPSSLNWALGLVTELFCSCLSQAAGEGALCFYTSGSSLRSLVWAGN